MKTEIRNIAYYESLPYTTVLRRDEDGDIVARVEELQGCVTHGKDERDALKNLSAMKRLWFKDAMAAGEEIPEPARIEETPSGQWLQRAPRRLHGQPRRT